MPYESLEAPLAHDEPYSFGSERLARLIPITGLRTVRFAAEVGRTLREEPIERRSFPARYPPIGRRTANGGRRTDRRRIGLRRRKKTEKTKRKPL